MSTIGLPQVTEPRQGCLKCCRDIAKALGGLSVEMKRLKAQGNGSNRLMVALLVLA